MIKLLLVFFVSATGLIYLQSIPGGVHLSFDGREYQLSFFSSASLILASFVGLILVLVIFNFLLDLPKTIRNIFRNRQSNLSRNDLQKSFTKLMLGDFANAEKLALKRIHYSKNQGLHLLLGAFSAYKLGDITAAEKYIHQSNYFLKEKDDLSAFKSFNATIRMGLGYAKEAQLILEDLTEKMPRNSYLLENLTEIYIHQKNYIKAYQILSKIKKARVYSAEKYKEVEAKITSSTLESAMYSENLIQFTEFWNTLYRKQKNNSMIKLQYFFGLVYLAGFKGKENSFNRFIISNIENDKVWNFLHQHSLLGTKLNKIKLKNILAKQQNSLANVVLAQSFFDTGSVDEAIEVAKNCAKTWQEIPVWKLLAEIYEKQNQQDKAFHCYRIINQKELQESQNESSVLTTKTKKEQENQTKTQKTEEIASNLISLTWMDKTTNSPEF